jgi:hypothetical protein
MLKLRITQMQADVVTEDKEGHYFYFHMTYT